MLIILFLVSHFNFLFVLCGRLSWLRVSFLLHVKYTLSYRIVWTKDGSKRAIPTKEVSFGGVINVPINYGSEKTKK